MTKKTPAPEFSIEIELDALPRDGRTFHVQANASERAAIAKRIGALSLEKLEAEIQLVATPKTLLAKGRIDAALIRECVASLEELTEKVDETFEIEFLRSAHGDEQGQTNDPWDAPEVHEGGMFDAGEFVVQQLSLAMDPFPRKPDAPNLVEKYGRAPETSPFSGLAAKLEKSEKNQ